MVRLESCMALVVSAFHSRWECLRDALSASADWISEIREGVGRWGYARGR